MFLRSWYVRRELKKIRNTFGEKKINIYDAGSGYGQYTYFMSKKLQPCEIYSVDVKTDWINDCREFFSSQKISNVAFEVEDLTNIKHTDKFDLIVCVDVMEHILEDEQVFRNYSASLKSGGMLVISTPSDKGGSDVHGDDQQSFIEEHVRDGYNIDDIKAKLLRNGFSRAEAKYSYGTPGKISWRLSMKYPISALGYTKAFFVVLPFYYLLFYPVCFVLNYFDVNMTHPTGTGLIVKAWK